jgi:hypothetical protein
VSENPTVINVAFIAFPDGQHFWLKSDFEAVKQCIDNWKESLSAERRAEFETAGACMVLGELRMLERDYLNIASQASDSRSRTTDHDDH